MPTQKLIYKCLIISPGDVGEERDAIAHAIRDWNAHAGNGLNALVEPVMWETHSRPEMGAEPQAIINRQLLDTCDFGIAVFWPRLGTPTQSYVSGSIEEIHRLVARNARVMVYESTAPIPKAALRDDQYSQLQEQLKELRRQGLVGSFTDATELRRLVVLHINALVADLLLADRAAGQPIPSSGTLTAPMPDIGVDVDAVLVGDAMRRMINVVIKNRSPRDFFFKSIEIIVTDGTKMVPTIDAFFHQPILPKKIEPGDSHNILLEPIDIFTNLKGRSAVGVIVRDKTDRSFAANIDDVIDALELCANETSDPEIGVG